MQAFYAILAWKEQYWTLLNRAHCTLVAAALIALLWWVHAGNLWAFCL